MSEAARATGTPVRVLGGLGVGTLVAFAASLGVGPASGFLQTIRSLAGERPAMTVLIIEQIRLPRALLGLAIGITLGLSGAALQGYLRNPLAEPGLIGVSSAAALGAVIAFYSGLAGSFAWAMPLGGMLGALLAVLLVQALAGREAGSLSLILAGVAVTSFAAALTALALNLAPNPFAALEIVFWMMGSLADRSFTHLWLAGPFMLLGWALLLGLGRPLDALTLGEEAASSLGFDLGAVRWRLVLGTALSVGAATSVAGAIGFVGLVVPHLLRPLVGNRPSQLLAASALGGAILTLTADILVRVITPGRELKLGVVTALIGAPFFFALVIRARRSMA